MRCHDSIKYFEWKEIAGCLKRRKIQSLASKTIYSSVGESKQIHRKSLEKLGAGISALEDLDSWESMGALETAQSGGE